MTTRWAALFLAIALVIFVAAFMWATLRTDAQGQNTPAGGVPTATISEVLSDGRIEAQVFATGDRDVRLEIQFAPDADALEAAGLRPIVNFAMVDMHMDGFNPPLELVEAGVWRTQIKLPMAGRWIVSVGFGEEFAEVEFDAE